MRQLLAFIALSAVLCLTTSAFAEDPPTSAPASAAASAPAKKAELPACKADGATAEIDGKPHTCGVCARAKGGALTIWAPGKHAAKAMKALCTAPATAAVAKSIRVKIVAPPERKY
jgi:hypothetical protein